MKYSEAKKQIEALSSKYDANLEDGDFYVVYNKNVNVRGIFVGGNHEYVLDIGWVDTFSSMPLCDKLYMILAELAITPLDERGEEKKYYVKVGDSIFSYLNIYTVTNKMLMMVGDTCETKFIKTKFTDKDIEELKQYDNIPLDWSKVTLEDAEQEILLVG